MPTVEGRTRYRDAPRNEKSDEGTAARGPSNGNKHEGGQLRRAGRWRKGAAVNQLVAADFVITIAVLNTTLVWLNQSPSNGVAH